MGLSKYENAALAMELSDGLFAWHLIGTMTAICERDETVAHYMPRLCPDPEEVALEYLQTQYPNELKKKYESTLDATPEVEV